MAITKGARTRHGQPRGQATTRPRIEGDREVELLDATLTLLATVGYDRLTMDAVAAAAKASKATLYRRWDSKADLVIDALSRAKAAPQVHDLDTGSLRGDLIGVACSVGGLNDKRLLAMLGSVITALQHDPEFADAFNQRFIAPKLEANRQIFERARVRGEIAESVDLDLMAPVLAAIILHRAFVLGLSVDDAIVARIVDEIVLPALTYGAAPAESSPDS